MAVPSLMELIFLFIVYASQMCSSLVDALNISETVVGCGQRVAHVVSMHLCDPACSTVKLSCMMQYLELVHASATLMIHIAHLVKIARMRFSV